LFGQRLRRAIENKQVEAQRVSEATRLRDGAQCQYSLCRVCGRPLVHLRPTLTAHSAFPTPAPRSTSSCRRCRRYMRTVTSLCSPGTTFLSPSRRSTSCTKTCGHQVAFTDISNRPSHSGRFPGPVADADRGAQHPVLSWPGRLRRPDALPPVRCNSRSFGYGSLAVIQRRVECAHLRAQDVVALAVVGSLLLNGPPSGVAGEATEHDHTALTVRAACRGHTLRARRLVAHDAEPS
jgi:hypothetical protein